MLNNKQACLQKKSQSKKLNIKALNGLSLHVILEEILRTTICYGAESN
jgi:hypothetical protein